MSVYCSSTANYQKGAAVKRIGWILFLCALLAGCQLPIAVNTSPSNVQKTVALGEAVELKPGETALVAEPQLRVTFDKVTEDSRCPSSVSCAWSGIVNVQMTAASQSQPSETFVVGGATDGYGVITKAIPQASGPTNWPYGNFVVELKQVTPYPARTDKHIAPGVYRATVVITTAN